MEETRESAEVYTDFVMIEQHTRHSYMHVLVKNEMTHVSSRDY